MNSTLTSAFTGVTAQLIYNLSRSEYIYLYISATNDLSEGKHADKKCGNEFDSVPHLALFFSPTAFMKSVDMSSFKETFMLLA